ncbi:MAG TPA: hypothetical protein VLG27_02220 [Candidatus Saccharimonadia bacterium]|nr:hypothetical protein [Candidatus Saccharimonadia bacterium]
MGRYLRCLYISVGLNLVVGFAVSAAPVSAASTAKSGSNTNSGSSSQTPTITNLNQSIVQSYNADPKVLPGMLVELKDKQSDTVTPLTEKDIKKMLGVVVPIGQAAVVLSPPSSPTGQVLVATSGRFNVLVSNQGGPVKIGDYITASAIDGVAMKASPTQQEILGRAITIFDGKKNVLGTVQLKVTGGHTLNVAIGTITLDMELKQNPLVQKTVSYLPQFVVNAAVGIAQKPVSSGRIYLGVVMMFIILFVTSNMVFSGVRSGMISIGRNPLSKKSIIRSLIQTVIAGLFIFAAGLFAVYLILKL